MKPSLDGAYARISRAEEHIERLKREEPTTIFDDTDWEPERYGSLALRETDVAGTIISILVGEIVYNLRAALDYLVYELAFLDSGSIQDGTQFPIEDTNSRFDAHKTWRIKPRRNKPGKPGYIQFLNAAHQAAIERLQPYRRSQEPPFLSPILHFARGMGSTIAAHVTSTPRLTRVS